MCASTPYLTGWTRITLFGLPPSFCSCIPLPFSYLSLLSLHHHIPLIVCPLSSHLHLCLSIHFCLFFPPPHLFAPSVPKTDLHTPDHVFHSFPIHLSVTFFILLSYSVYHTFVYTSSFFSPSPTLPPSLSLTYFPFLHLRASHHTFHPSYLDN